MERLGSGLMAVALLVGLLVAGCTVAPREICVQGECLTAPQWARKVAPYCDEQNGEGGFTFRPDPIAKETDRKAVAQALVKVLQEREWSNVTLHPDSWVVTAYCFL